MAKLLEGLGLIEGYDISSLGKYSIKRDNMFEEIKKKDSNIQEEAREIIDNSNGVVFIIYKKKLIHGIYLFKEETKGEEKYLNLVKSVFTDEVSDEVKTKYQDHLVKFAKEQVSYLEYDKVSLENDIVTTNGKKTKQERLIALAGGFAVGFVLGFIIFGDILFGVLWGIIFAPLFSGVDVVVSKKRNKKKKK